MDARGDAIPDEKAPTSAPPPRNFLVWRGWLQLKTWSCGPNTECFGSLAHSSVALFGWSEEIAQGCRSG